MKMELPIPNGLAYGVVVFDNERINIEFDPDSYLAWSVGISIAKGEKVSLKPDVINGVEDPSHYTLTIPAKINVEETIKKNELFSELGGYTFSLKETDKLILVLENGSEVVIEFKIDENIREKAKEFLDAIWNAETEEEGEEWDEEEFEEEEEDIAVEREKTPKGAGYHVYCENCPLKEECRKAGYMVDDEVCYEQRGEYEIQRSLYPYGEDDPSFNYPEPF